MNFEDLLNRFTHNVESIIQWLFFFILALSGVLISRWLLFKKSDIAEGAGLGAAAPEISSAIEKILERTAKLESTTVQPMSPEQLALAETQVQGLKKELSAREEELKALKAAGGAAGGAANNDEVNKLTNRLKELEAKLAEYEILEDDIADLSLYKEENVRLRSEVEKLRNAGGGAVTAPSAAVDVKEADVAAAIAAAAGGAEDPAAALVAELGAAEAAPAPAAPAPEPAPPSSPEADIVAEFASAVAADASAVPEMTMQVPDTGNPMKDFEAAVQIEQRMKSAATPAQAARAASGESPAAPAAPAATPPPATATATAQQEADDMFAEFTESPDTSVAEGSLDTDKMMAEMAALVNLEPSGSALEEGIDIDKMAFEATGSSAQKR